MATKVYLPLIGLYNHDQTILDGLTALRKSELDASLQYVSNIPELSTADLHALLLAEIGDLSVIYADPAVMKSMITTWAKAERPQWLKLWQTMLYKYNPIWNKDGTYSESRLRSGSNISSSNTTTTETTSGTSTDSGSRSGTDTTTYGKTLAHNVTGYNTNSYSPDTQEVAGGRDSVSHSESTSGSGKTTGSLSGKQNGSASGQYSDSETLTRTEQGNIGVTTTQAMIREERDIDIFNIYSYIIQAFKQRFCLMVY